MSLTKGVPTPGDPFSFSADFRKYMEYILDEDYSMKRINEVLVKTGMVLGMTAFLFTGSRAGEPQPQGKLGSYDNPIIVQDGATNFYFGNYYCIRGTEYYIDRGVSVPMYNVVGRPKSCNGGPVGY